MSKIQLQSETSLFFEFKFKNILLMIALDGIQVSEPGDIVDIRQNKSISKIMEFHITIGLNTVKFLENFPYNTKINEHSEFWLSYNMFNVIVQTPIFTCAPMVKFSNFKDTFKIGGSVEDLISFMNRCYPLPIFLCSEGYIHGECVIDFSELIRIMKKDGNYVSSHILLTLPILPLTNTKFKPQENQTCLIVELELDNYDKTTHKLRLKELKQPEPLDIPPVVLQQQPEQQQQQQEPPPPPPIQQQQQQQYSMNNIEQSSSSSIPLPYQTINNNDNLDLSPKPTKSSILLQSNVNTQTSFSDNERTVITPPRLARNNNNIKPLPSSPTFSEDSFHSSTHKDNNNENNNRISPEILQEITNLTRQNAELFTENGTLRDKNNEIIQHLEQLKRNDEEQKRLYIQTMNKAAEEYQRLEKELKLRIEKEKTKEKELLNRVLELDKKENELKTYKVECDHKVKTKEYDIQSLKDQIKTRDNEIQKYQMKLEKSQQDYDLLNDKYKSSSEHQLLQQISKIEGEKAVLNGQISVWQAKYEGQVSENEKLKGQLYRLSRELIKLRESKEAEVNRKLEQLRLEYICREQRYYLDGDNRKLGKLMEELREFRSKTKDINTNFTINDENSLCKSNNNSNNNSSISDCSINSDADNRIKKLAIKRDNLLNDGYAENDAMIIKINQKIEELKHQYK